MPKSSAAHFPDVGSHLERYAARLAAVEINSSFYRPHQPQTYARWAAAVPEPFRFAVKMPKSITHTNRLRDVAELLDSFLGEAAALEEKLGPLLVQLPPSLAYDRAAVDGFFSLLRERFAGSVVCEPRHSSWFAAEADQLLTDFQVARVAADPALSSPAGVPGGWPHLAYYRLHGSPRIYYSAYAAEFLDTLVAAMQNSKAAVVWCIFDNTAAGAATANALDLAERLETCPAG